MGQREKAKNGRTLAGERVRDELLGDNLDLNRETERFKMLGDPTRFIILYLLATDGETTSGDLATALDRKQNDLYHHLNKLEDAGLVGKYPEGNNRVYELSPLAEELVTGVVDSIRGRAQTA